MNDVTTLNESIGISSDWIDLEKVKTRPFVKICDHIAFMDVTAKPITEIRTFDVITVRCATCGDRSIMWEVEC